MLVRMSEARVVPGRLEEFAELTRRVAFPLMRAAPGFLGGELYRAEDPPLLVMITRWRDEDALAAFDGPDWRDQPVILADEEQFLVRPSHVWHFTPVDVD